LYYSYAKANKFVPGKVGDFKHIQPHKTLSKTEQNHKQTNKQKPCKYGYYSSKNINFIDNVNVGCILVEPNCQEGVYTSSWYDKLGGLTDDRYIRLSLYTVK